MKRLPLLLVLGLLFLSCACSRSGYKIVGDIFDLDETDINLLDAYGSTIGSAPVKDGKFVIEGRVDVPCLAYLNNGLGVNYPIDIPVLLENAKIMKEAVVEAQLAQVEMKEDTFVYNAGAFRTPEGSMLEDLVKKLPGAEVDDNGNITINGKTVKKIMVDGKEFFSNDTKMAMKNLPTKMVEKIKSYERKSDYSRVTGIDDGDEETVLDLTVKKGMKEGWLINADGAYGTEDRYTAKLSVNRFMDHYHFSLIGSANNVNDRSMGGWGGRGGRGGGGGGGIVSSQMAGVNFAWENGKKENEAGLLKTGGNVRFSRTDTDNSSTTNSQTFLSGSSRWNNSFSASNPINWNLNADFRLE